MQLIAYPSILKKQSAAPTITANSVLWRDTDDNKLYYSDGTSWNDMAAAGGGILEVDVSTDMNTTQAVSGTDEAYFESAAISAATLVGANYLILKSLVTYNAHDDSSATRRTFPSVKFQTKEIGGAYTDSMSYVDAPGADGSLSSNVDTHGTFLVEWIHTLTAGEKANGVQVRIYSHSYCSAASVSCSVSNKQGSIALSA